METIIDQPDRETPVPGAVVFTEVVVGLEHRLVRLAVLLSGGAADAEDVVAEAASRVWVRWRKGGVESLHGYLRVAVINEVHRRGSPFDARPAFAGTPQRRGTGHDPAG